MDMYQKREQRKKNKIEKENRININWFPGHMAKTRRQITEDLKLIDVVIELLDARIPVSSQNPEIAQIVKNKKKIVILNKCDLAEDKQNNLWIDHFKKIGISAILVDANSGRGIEASLKEVEKIMKEDLMAFAEKGRVGRKIRVMILGIPNVGKSSYINRVAKKVSAQVGNRPGVTRAKQWIRVNERVELLDTPGVLWPKFESETVALNLAFTGTIKDDILERTEIAYELLRYLIFNYRENFCERYGFSEDYIEAKLEQPQAENSNIYEIMQDIGRKRGCIVSGGNIDDEKIARILLDEFREGRLGRITLENCID